MGELPWGMVAGGRASVKYCGPLGMGGIGGIGSRCAFDEGGRRLACWLVCVE